MKKYYCTYFDRNYLFKAMALIESLNRHEKDFQLFVVCLDEISRIILEKLNLQNVKTIPLHQIEEGDSSLISTKKDRTLVEYYFTITPTIILRILERNPEIDILTYLDADLFFFSSSDPIFEEFGNNSVLIHEHRYSPSLTYLEQPYGKYNVALLCFRNDKNGIQVLTWWRERCIEWCYNRHENGKFADQLYLNDWTERFEGVKVLQHVGAGLAPWNHVQYHYSQDASGNILVDRMSLIFYHFHALNIVYPDFILPVKFTNYPALTVEILKWLYIPYIYALYRQIAAIHSVFPDFRFGLESHIALPSNDHVFIAKRRLSDSLRKRGVKQICVNFDNEWDGYCSTDNVRDVRKPIADIWLDLPSDQLEKAYIGDMGNQHRRIMESNLRNEPLTQEENIFLQHLIAELTKRSATDPVSAMNYLLAAMLYLPSDRLKIENARASLPGWLIGDYEGFFGF